MNNKDINIVEINKPTTKQAEKILKDLCDYLSKNRNSSIIKKKTEKKE